jgi:pilus assembly protein CpaB
MYMSSRKGKVAVGLALVLGIATSYMVYTFLNRARLASQAVPTTKVVTAVRDIPARTAITSAMVRVVDVPVPAKLPLAVSSVDQMEGKVTKLPIYRGEQVLPTKLFVTQEDSGLAFVVPPGKRAVAVGVSELVGSGGMIVPGDYVDVLAVIDAHTQNGQSTQGDKQQISLSWEQEPSVSAVAQYILQNVQVLAVAQNLETNMPGEAPAPKTPGPALPGQTPQNQVGQSVPANPTAHTATLAVDPTQAQRLVLAEDKGRIRLVLRSHGDDSTMNIQDGLFVGGGSSGMVGLKAEPRPQ